jgi:hypothetical protein
MLVPQVIVCTFVCPVCAHTCAHLQVASHVSGSPPHACPLVCAYLGSRCRGEGRVLAHTSKQHHELLLPAYPKIATAKKPGQAGPWGRDGWKVTGKWLRAPVQPCA